MRPCLQAVWSRKNSTRCSPSRPPNPEGPVTPDREHSNRETCQTARCVSHSGNSQPKPAANPTQATAAHVSLSSHSLVKEQRGQRPSNPTPPPPASAGRKAQSTARQPTPREEGHPAPSLAPEHKDPEPAAQVGLPATPAADRPTRRSLRRRPITTAPRRRSAAVDRRVIGRAEQGCQPPCSKNRHTPIRAFVTTACSATCDRVV